MMHFQAWRKIVIYKIVFAPRILHVFVLLVHWIFEQLMNFILMCTLLRHRLTAQLSRAVRFKCARTKHAVSRWALSTECVADTETVSNSKQSISNFTNNFIKRTSNFTNFTNLLIICSAALTTTFTHKVRLNFWFYIMPVTILFGQVFW